MQPPTGTNWHPGPLSPERAAFLSMRSAEDEAEYLAGRKVAYHVIHHEMDRRGLRETKRMGRPPVSVMSDRDEVFASAAEAAKAVGLKNDVSIHIALKHGRKAAGRRWFRAGVEREKTSKVA